MNGAMMKQAVYSLRDSMRALGHDLNASRVEEIVTLHAMIGAAAAVVPGAGALIATGVAGTSVLTMYVRLSDEMDITFRDGALRALASGVVADLRCRVSCCLYFP